MFAKCAVLDTLTRELVSLSGDILPAQGALLLLAALPALIWYGFAWLVWGRDHPLGTVIPRYSPPQNISPALTATLLRVQPRTAFVASLLSLMAKGRLSRSGGRLWAPEGTDDTPLPGEEQTILEAIGKGRSIGLHPDDRGMYRTYSRFTRKCAALYRNYVNQNRRLVAVGILIQVAALFLLADRIAPVIPLLLLPAVYFPFLYLGLKYTRRGKNRVFVVFFLSLHFLIMGLVILTVFSHASSFPGMLAQEGAVLLVMAMHALFFRFLDKPNAAAVKLLAEIEGLRLFIATADAGRYAIMPPGLQEKNLPYAVIFDLEKTWIEDFSFLEGVLPWHRGGE